MSYSYEALATDKTKANYLQKCFYLMNLIKAQNHTVWEKYKERYEHTKPEESWELYNQLLAEYTSLAKAPVAQRKKVQPAKAEAEKVVKKAAVKKTPAKKKAPAKKAPVKKAPAKKAPAKKAAPKKTTKKK